MGRKSRCCVVGIETGRGSVPANGQLSSRASVEDNGLGICFAQDSAPASLRNSSAIEGNPIRDNSRADRRTPSEGDNSNDGSSHVRPNTGFLRQRKTTSSHTESGETLLIRPTPSTQAKGDGIGTKIGAHSTSFFPPTPSEVHPTPPSSSPLSPASPYTPPLPPVQGHHGTARRKGKFADLVFTANFTAFDRQNSPAARDSPFHGFFTLFWMAVFLFVVKIGADNWRRHGSVLGTNEIMRGMFLGEHGREVVVLLLADGAMCALTGVTWAVQRGLVRQGWVDWNGWGWVVQSVWQVMFIGGVIGLPLVRDWPWTHTVFFVLHGMVMLMKQHSYAFYNGHLSSAYKQRGHLLSKIKQLESISPVATPSSSWAPESSIATSHLAGVPSARWPEERRQSLPCELSPDLEKITAAIESGKRLDLEQIRVFERVLKWEVDALSDELRGKSTRPGAEYPSNLTLRNHYEYIVLPTVVYELEYPRSESINWYYAAEKAAACFGIIFVMIMISQAFIYPVVMDMVRMKEQGVPLPDRFRQFPWMLLDLIFPFMMEYLLTWYLIWEAILNFVAELTYFADRSFYDAWWNSVSWDQFARDWNRPVHNFLLRHVYHSSISAMKVDRHTATLITFFLSACAHELVMWCIFKKLRGYLLFLQMCQLPVSVSLRTRIFRR